jgi:hypothetical protein
MWGTSDTVDTLYGVVKGQSVQYVFVVEYDSIGYWINGTNGRVDMPQTVYAYDDDWTNPPTVYHHNYVTYYFKSLMVNQSLFYIAGDEPKKCHYSNIVWHYVSSGGDTTRDTSTTLSDFNPENLSVPTIGHFTQVFKLGVNIGRYAIGMTGFVGAEFKPQPGDFIYAIAKSDLTLAGIRTIGPTYANSKNAGKYSLHLGNPLAITVP